MTRQHVYFLALVVLAVVLFQLLPRYEWHQPPGGGSALIRVDRWSGDAELGAFRVDEDGRQRWTSLAVRLQR
ncbi:MAG: hypothetical protein AB7Q15_18675 [Vicinamibacterales bacterium]